MTFNREMLEEWKRVTLSDVVEINPCYKMDDKSGDLQVSFIPMSGISESGKIIETEMRSFRDVCKGYTRFADNDVLFAKITPCMENGKRALVKNLKNGMGFGSTEFYVLRVKDELIPEYLYYLISSPLFRKEAEANMTGSAGQKRVPTIFLKSYVFNLPPKQMQWRIIKALEKVQSLIDKKKQQIKLLDELILSVFIDMFGDPIVNPKGWCRMKLGEVGDVERGKSKHRPRNAPELLGGEYPLIQTGDISNSGFYIKSYNNTYSELGLKQSKLWPKGTLCITIAANIARTAILTFEACFPDSVVAFTPNNLVINTYVQLWFLFLQKNLEESAPKSAQKNINLKILNALEIPVPPIDKQLRFDNIMREIVNIKCNLEGSLNQLEITFNSIMQKAFDGELFI